MTTDLDIAGVAAARHCSVDHAQRMWRAWCEAEGFPRPWTGEGRGQRPWWTLESIDAWKLARATGRAGAPTAFVTPAQPEAAAGPANDARPHVFTDHDGLLAGLAS